ncbi:hypothetical protein [Intrasporangium sp. DVR]|uniref:hypothetical protein n=1 Tax=Intrasporangium sp. DVR TaxID=3127867 RepID=UPI00313A6EED
MSGPLGGSWAESADRTCSAKGCRAAAVHAVVWRNPKLHVEGRRKVWLACDDHAQSLADFVGVRGFLIEIIPVGALTEADG